MGRPTLLRQAAEEILRSDRRGEAYDARSRLPVDVAPHLAADVVLSLLDGAFSKGCWLLGRRCQRLAQSIVLQAVDRTVLAVDEGQG